MITIKFPKKPRSSDRSRIQQELQKYDYSEDEYDSIVKIEKLDKGICRLILLFGFWKKAKTIFRKGEKKK